MAENSRTLILIKPDAFERGLTGEVLARFERKGLRISRCGCSRRRGDRQSPLRGARREAVLRRAGLVHHRRPARRRGARGPRGGPAARQLIGATNPIEAAPGSIRGDYGLEVTFNLVHGSDSDESAEREIAIWFPEPPG